MAESVSSISTLSARRIVLVKGAHRWIFQWDAAGAGEIVARAGALAQDDDVDFDWFDAAMVCREAGTSVASAVARTDQPSPDGSA